MMSRHSCAVCGRVAGATGRAVALVRAGEAWVRRRDRRGRRRQCVRRGRRGRRYRRVRQRGGGRNARDAPPRLAVFDAVFFHRAETRLAPLCHEAWIKQQRALRNSLFAFTRARLTPLFLKTERIKSQNFKKIILTRPPARLSGGAAKS